MQGEETLNLPAGESEIIFTHIANSVTDDSIAISIDNGVTVLSSRIELQETQPNALPSEIQQQLKAAKVEQVKLTAEKNNIAAQIKVLEANSTLTNKSAAEVGKSLDIQLNRDPKLIIQRKAALKKENALSIFNDSTIRNFSYTLNVKNSYGEAVDITLLDQIPVSTNSDITVEKMQYGQAQFDAKTGKLTWTLKLSGKENVSLPFSYSVKYPKGMHPSGM
ncbi:DUF4139 domain-containing protein [Escherichia marmotae]|nr:DUF4139 domain-containing protein [Escherichia marmotae]